MCRLGNGLGALSAVLNSLVFKQIQIRLRQGYSDGCDIDPALKGSLRSM